MLTLKRYFVLVWCLVCVAASAQKNPYGEVTISSPTAASLGKYADIPVSYHTGLPQISIPLYSVAEGPLSLPVSLSYHAGGVKVMEPASWVGTGWSLSAGGMITRTVQGAPDEKGTSNVDNHSHGYFSDNGFHNYLYNGVDVQGRPFAHWGPFAEGKKDGEPDLFFFNFAGYSGKFYFQDDRTPVMVPEQDVKIEYNYTVGQSIASFIITTPDGTKYHFGKTSAAGDVDPIEKTNPVTADQGLSFGDVISSWYLNKIVSADGIFSISLSYEQENYSYYTLSMYPVPFNNIQGTGSTPNFDVMYEYKLVKNVVQGVRLSKISFSNGEVNFIPGSVRLDLGDDTYTGLLPDYVNDDAKSLGAVEITNNAGVCKKFVFSYGYFESGETSLNGYLANYGSIETDKKRLKLTNVREQSCDGSLINPPHVFEYESGSNFLPRRLSFGQDHWGFYNGVNGNTTLIPTYKINTYNTVTGANRDAAWPAMKAGALSKITYPTGGYSEFSFEPNETWISYPTYGAVGVWQQPIGYSLAFPPPVQQTITLAAGDYELRINSTAGGSDAGLTLTNSNNVTVAAISANPGQDYSQTFNDIPAGQYTVTLIKDCPSTGIGATGFVSIWTAGTESRNEKVGGLRISRSGITMVLPQKIR